MARQVYSEYYCSYFQLIPVVRTRKEIQYLENSNENKQFYYFPLSNSVKNSNALFSPPLVLPFSPAEIQFLLLSFAPPQLWELEDLWLYQKRRVKFQQLKSKKILV